MSKLDQILTDIETKAAEVTRLFDEADTQHNGDMPEDARERVKTLNQEIEGLEQRAVDLKGDEAIRAANARRLIDLKSPAPGARDGLFPGGGGKSEERKLEAAAKSMGLAFVESADWKEYLKTVAPHGQVSERQRVQSPPAQVNALLKTLVTGAASGSGGAFVVNDQSGIYDPLGRRMLTLRDIVSVRQTTSDVVEYVRQLTRVNAAATVAEATATSGSTGTKPEGGMTFERVTAAVKTIAEWVPATKRALADAGQMRGIIDQELRADLEEELEDQILNGDGVGENFEGLDTVSGTQDQAYDTSLLKTTRKARTLVKTVGRAVPTAYVMNPSDWEAFDLLTDGETRYYFGGPSVLGNPRLWGVPVVECEAQAAGNAWLGDFRRIVIWDREQANISVSDSHSDFFIRNLVAILAEMRAAMGVIRPAAFVEVDLTA